MIGVADRAAADVIAAGARFVSDLGLVLSLEADLERLRALNVHVQRTDPSAWYPLVPLILPEARVEDGWWLRVHDPREEDRGAEASTVACYGDRLVRLAPGRSLRDRIESLDLFYRDGPRPFPGETLRLSGDAAPIADGISACVVSFGVAGWTRPDHRGRRLVGVLAELCRTIALDRWGALDLAYRGEVGFVPRHHVDAGMVVRRYGYEGSVPRVDWRGGVLGDLLDAELMWSPVAAIRRQVKDRAATGF